MPKLIPRALCLLLCVLLGCLASPVALAREYSSVSRDYAVTSLTSSEVRGGRFTVHAAFSYYGVSQKYSYTEGGNFYECGPCKGTGYRTCAACKGEGGKMDYSYVPCQLCHGHSEPYCQRSCDGTDYMCSVCGHLQTSNFGHQNYCNHPWAWYPYADCKCKTNKKDTIWVECKVCHGDGMRECPRCHGNGWYETGGHIVTCYPSDPFPQSVTVDFLLDGAVVSTGPLTLTVHTEKSNNQSWEKWASADAEATISAGVGIHQVEARINWQGRKSEINRNNNSQTISVEVRPVIDLAGEFIPPGANYRAGTEVISAFRIYNRDPEGNGQDVIPTDRLRADFSAVNPATGAALAAQTASAIVIPRGGGNIVYFKWRVPEDYPSGPVSLRLHINPDGAVDETNVGNNICVASNGVARPRDSDTPDTQFAARAPAGWQLPNGNEPISTDGILTTAPIRNSASWQEWAWDAGNKAFVLKTLGVKLTPNLVAEPDERALSRKWLVDQKSWQMGSGYGFTLQATGEMQAVGTTPPASAYTNAQSAQAHYPEFQYAGGKGKYSLLDRTGAGKFELKLNTNSTSGTGAVDPRRLHYTPLWYPDGRYTVRTMLYDCWTPAGMLVAEQAAPPLTINGSIYDDQYVGH